jgi:hypothetical protein
MKRLALSALGVAALCLSGTPIAANSQDGTVTVVIHRIKAISNFDGDFLKKDRADFYAKVSIGGYWQNSPVWHGQDDARPAWAGVETGMGRVVPILIRVMDEDGAFEDKDDMADINPTIGVKELQLWYDTQSGRIWGDAQGRKGQKIHSRGGGSDSDKAEIWFSIS